MKKIIATIVTTALLVSVPMFAARVDRRQKEQQERIAQGVKSGQLTAHETVRLEREQARLQAEKHDMREDNGGTLTNGEKVRLNNQQNRLSRQIYQQKHDGQHQ
jgi:predicted amidophosphoribosyltransferase